MELFLGRPVAEARILGDGPHSGIRGTVRFYPFRGELLLVADIRGLPRGQDRCPDGIFALHIHEGNSCAGEGFPRTEGHYNPDRLPHPCHAGDLLPLFAHEGRAFLAVCTGRFSLGEILGRTVVIHGSPDDFTTQPAGGAGEKIACGVIRRG